MIAVSRSSRPDRRFLILEEYDGCCGIARRQLGGRVEPHQPGSCMELQMERLIHEWEPLMVCAEKNYFLARG
jgi:hypothetical protein